SGPAEQEPRHRTRKRRHDDHQDPNEFRQVAGLAPCGGEGIEEAVRPEGQHEKGEDGFGHTRMLGRAGVIRIGERVGVRARRSSLMPRAIWSGSISFGLVNVPVKLYAAVQQQDIHFSQFEEGTGARVRNKRVSEKSGKEVSWENIVKGYEVTKGHFVT